ncbi:MAG: hypothetical protein AAF585_17220 [Verrucomicrobiota bacterium]
MSENEDKKGWFDHKENVRKVIFGLFILCAGFILVDVVFWVIKFHGHPYFKWETWPGFYAVYGFVACVLLVFVSRFLLRPLVKRREDFYGKSDSK